MSRDISKEVREIFNEVRGNVVRASDLQKEYDHVVDTTFSTKQKLYGRYVERPLKFVLLFKESFKAGFTDDGHEYLKMPFKSVAGNDSFIEMDAEMFISEILERASPFKKLQRNVTQAVADAAKECLNYRSHVDAGGLVRAKSFQDFDID